MTEFYRLMMRSARLARFIPLASLPTKLTFDEYWEKTWRDSMELDYWENEYLNALKGKER